MTLHQKMALDDIGNPEKGLLLNAQELEYVKKFLDEHPDYQGRIPKKSEKNPDSPLRYSVVVVPDQHGIKQSYAIYDKILGEGAYGKVKIYQNIYTGESVAAKSIRENAAKPDLKMVLEREIEVLKNIGELHGTYSRKRIIDSQDNEVNYLIMNLGYGVPLEKILFTESMEKSPELDIFDQTITENQRTQHLLNQTDIALEVIRECIELHQKEYINRDIKLTNYLWDDKLKRVKLIDHGFDISFKDAAETRMAIQHRDEGKDLSDREEVLLRSIVFGTPPYIPPEVWMGKGPSVASDFYAIGVLLANVMSISDKEGGYALREDQEENVFKDFPGTIANIISAGKDEELQELYSEVYEDGPHLLSPPELQQMANVIRGLTHEDEGQRLTAQQAFDKLLALKTTLLAKLNHHDNAEFHIIKVELNSQLKILQDKVKAESEPLRKAVMVQQEKVMLDLVTLTNLLSSSYPIQKELLIRFKNQLDEANHLVAKEPAFARSLQLMENAFNKVAKNRNTLEDNKENLPPENANKRRPPPLKTQFDKHSKNQEPFRELPTAKNTSSDLETLPSKKPKA